MNLAKLSSIVTPALRSRLHVALWDTLRLPTETADAALNLMLSELAAFVPPRRVVRNPAAQARRREVLLEMVRSGHSLAEVARALDLSYASVSKLLAAARADGCDLPAQLPRGRRPKGAQRLVEVVPMLQQGYTRAETAQALSMSARDVDHAALRARKQGVLVPNDSEVQKWRLSLDAVTAETLRVARMLKLRSFEEFADTPERAAAVEADLSRQFEALKAEVEELEASGPHGVSSPPSKEHRRAADTLRKAPPKVVLPLAKPTPTKVKDTPAPAPAPRPPVPANPLAAPQDAPKFGSLFQQMEEAQRARAEARARGAA